MEKKISIRNAKNAKTGLHDFGKYIKSILYESFKESLTCVEVGSFAGDSAEILSKYFDDIVCIDPWMSGYDVDDSASDPRVYNMREVEAEFDRRTIHLENVVKMKMTSEQAADEISDYSVHVVYIDAIHTYESVKKDIELWIPKIKKGGFIGGHDYASRHFPGVKKAVDEWYATCVNKDTPIHRYADSSWAVQQL